jgi:hypothetical protein
MEAVTIHDMRHLGGGRVLAVDLIDLLRLFESEVRTLCWACRDVWCMGDGAKELHQAAETGAGLDGRDLLRLAAGVFQVIDGEFVGIPPGGTRPRLVVVAEDSSYYVVATSERSFLDLVRQRFSDVRPSPEWAEQYAESPPTADPGR